MYYVNGQWLSDDETTVHTEDRGYQFGDGIYEVVRIYGGNLYQWEPHMERLYRSANELKLVLPWTKADLHAIATQLMERNEIGEQDDAIFYMQITRGASQRQFPFPKEAKPVLSAYVRRTERPLANMQHGVTAALVPDIRWLRCDIKSLNLLGAVLAKQQAVDAGMYDAIQHRDGTVTEGSASNLFAVKDGRLHTHPATNLILHGITRQTVLELASLLGIDVVEEAFSVDFVRDADELFFTGTTTEIMPIIGVDGQPVGSGQVGPVVRKLQGAFEQQIDG